MNFVEICRYFPQQQRILRPNLYTFMDIETPILGLDFSRAELSEPWN